MPYSVQAKNAMLDALGAVALYASIHKLSPGSLGSNELTGVTRQGITWLPASGGTKAHSNPLVFTGLLVAEPVGWLSLWSAASGGTYYGYQTLSTVSVTGGTTWTFTANPGTIDLNALASA